MSLTPEETEDLQLMLDAIEPEMKRLSDWERKFLGDQLDRFGRYGPSIRMSPKQWEVVRRCYQKVTGNPFGPTRKDVVEDDEDGEDY